VFVDFFNAKKEITVEEVKHEKDNIYLKFLNFDSPEQVKVFIDKNVYVDTGGLIKLPEDNYFVHDVIGSSVMKEQKPFGVVKDVLSYPANDVYVILKDDGSEFLLPAVLDFIESFDPQKKILILYPGDIYEDENED
jgi:16S rRNA processing protein RimM